MPYKKLSELKTEEKRSFRNEVDTVAIPISGDDWDHHNMLHKESSTPDYGLCSSCQYAIILKRKYGGWYGKCSRDEIQGGLHTIDNVEECTKYSKVGTMSLNDMYNLAYIIEVDKETIGF